MTRSKKLEDPQSPCFPQMSCWLLPACCEYIRHFQADIRSPSGPGDTGELSTAGVFTESLGYTACLPSMRTEELLCLPTKPLHGAETIQGAVSRYARLCACAVRTLSEHLTGNPETAPPTQPGAPHLELFPSPKGGSSLKSRRGWVGCRTAQSLSCQ